MGTITKLLAVAGVWYYIKNKHNSVNAATAYFQSTTGADTPLIDSAPVDSNILTDIIDDSWTSYATAIMSGNLWKINDYGVYAGAIDAAEQQYGIPTDLLARLLFQESRFRKDIINGTTKSSAGALGIAQFMPGTAAMLNINPLDPFEAIPAAAHYLADQYHLFGDWQTALAAYNWGPGNVQKWLAGNATMPDETQKYVSQISSDVSVA